MADRPKRPQRRRAEFKETLGAAQSLPAADVQAATRVTTWIALLLFALALAAIIVGNLMSMATVPSSNVPAGTIVPLSNATYDSARAAEAINLAKATDSSSGQTATAPVTSQANQYGESYALQGSVGTAAASHVEPTP